MRTTVLSRKRCVATIALILLGARALSGREYCSHPCEKLRNFGCGIPRAERFDWQKTRYPVLSMMALIFRRSVGAALAPYMLHSNE
jgi:hypothetical protein